MDVIMLHSHPRIFISIVLGVCVCRMAAHRHKSIHIGIFLDDDSEFNVSSIAVQSAVSRIKLLSKLQYNVKAHIYKVDKSDVFKVNQIVCELLEVGVAAIFGPESPETNEIVQSVAVAMEIPQFQMFWNPKLQRMRERQTRNENRDVQVFNLYPNPATLSKALATLIRENDWKLYTIVYENDDGLLRIQEALKERNVDHSAITIRKLQSNDDQRTVLKSIKSAGINQIILDCHIDNILPILRQAKELKLMEEFHSYIIPNLDVHTLNWTEFSHLKTNITALRLLDPQSYSLDDVVRDWELVEFYHNRRIHIPSNAVRTKTALLYDAVNLFITAFSELEVTENLQLKPLTCDGGIQTSSHGFRCGSFVHKRGLEKGLLPGPLTGAIRQFDGWGQRALYELQIIELSQGEFRKTGTWTPASPHVIHTIVSLAEREKEIKKQIQQKTFRVVSRLGPPYLMRRIPPDGSKKYEGNDRFEGYAVDLIDAICAILNCSYSFELVEDGNYGNYDAKTKQWNGLIRHLLDRKADLAVCDLTITYERRKAVDFTMPFMTLGISILYAKAVKEPPELLSFSHPLSLDVWLYMATAYLVISMIIFLVARLNPNDWENPHPCNNAPQELENIWDIKNCCWLTLGSIMAQGCDILPKGISTRMVAAMWWFFSLIMTASYTANLAAFLTMERMGPTIESAEDLAGQTKIKYGCLEGGATCSFFKDSNFSTYHRMWVQMESADPGVFEKNNKDGVKRVTTSKRKYAFLMESSSIEYEMERNCELMQVGSLLDSKGYGIAMPTNAPYRKSINEAILKMQEMGKLLQLKEKWWKEMNGGGQCKEEEHSSEATATELGLDHVGGVFVVLVGGVSIALIIAVLEFLWNVRKIAVTGKMTLRDAFDRELKFALNIWDRKKAVNPPGSKDEKSPSGNDQVSL